MTRKHGDSRNLFTLTGRAFEALERIREDIPSEIHDRPIPGCRKRSLRRITRAIEPLEAELAERVTRRARVAAARAGAGAPPRPLSPLTAALEDAATEALRGLNEVQESLASGDRLRDIHEAAGQVADDVFRLLGNARSFKSTAAIERLPKLAGPVTPPTNESESASG